MYVCMYVIYVCVCVCVYMQACIQGDLWLVDITAEAGILDLIIKKVNTNLGSIINYYGVKGAFKLS